MTSSTFLVISSSLTLMPRSSASFAYSSRWTRIGDGLVLERLVLGRAGLREVALLRGVGRLRARQELVERRLRDRGAVDDGDRVGRDLVGVAAACGDERDSGQCGGGEQERALHRDLVIGDAVFRTGCAVFGKFVFGPAEGRIARAQAARRAATIAAARPSAPSSPSVRSETSCRAEA